MPNLVGLDLNCQDTFCDAVKNNFAGTTYESRQARVCAGDEASAANNLSAVCGPLSGRAQGQNILLPGSVPVYGLCTTDLSREPTRSRDLSASPTFQTLPSRNSIRGGTQHPGQ